MEFFLLGPVQAGRAGRPVNLGVRKQRFVLAVLALEVNRQVTAERLVDLVWPGNPPASARGMIHTYISGLRTVLATVGDVCLESQGSCYTLRCDPARVDVHRFRGLVSRAKETDDDGQRVAVLDEALGLWRGQALADVADDDVRARLCHSLEEARLTATEDLVDARLRLGQHGDLAAELFALTGEHPHRPRLTGALMRVLHHTGRTEEALAVYQRLQRRLGAELGLDPPSELQELRQAILRADPDISAAVSTRPRPAQLPADLPTFTGRTTELDRLLAVPRPGIVVISAIEGMAGIGKTALAVHTAHRLAPRFPDGALFVDLHGFTHGIAPLAPADALDRMLRALGVPGTQIPHELDERAALYRSTLAGRRVLVVLDNAATEAQVEPLLPGAPGSLVLVTSRRRLIALDGGRPVALDVLPPGDARALFTRIAGDHHPPHLVAEITELCGRLPLAIRVAAARLRSRPTWTAAHLVTRLRDHRNRLAELDAGQRGVTAAIDLSYRQLTSAQARLFRLLGLHPGADIDTHAAAALADADLRQTGRLLDALVDAHLLQEPAPGRYRFHDLIRAHATATAERTEPDPRAAIGRLLDHYLHTAATAMDLLYPYETGQRPGVPRPGTPTPELATRARATAWLDTELANLLAAAGHAAGHDLPTHTSHFSQILARHLRTLARHTDGEAVHTNALHAAQQAGDPTAELLALAVRGPVRMLTGRYDQAIADHRQALDIAGRIGHHGGAQKALYGLGEIHRLIGDYDRASGYLRRSLTIARETGSRTGELHTLLGLGEIHRLTGHHDQATGSFGQALTIARHVRDRVGELIALYSLGDVHQLAGRYDEADDHYHQALAISRDISDRVGEVTALYSLGDVHRRRDQHPLATGCYRQALDIAREIADLNGQFEALLGLGHTLLATGHHADALTHHRAALDIADELGQRHDEARAHDGIARALHTLGHHDQARHHWHQALEIFTVLGTPEAATVRDLLSSH